jgi:hypothetical protein
MEEKKNFKLTDELIREALDRDLAAIESPPADQLWSAIEAGLAGESLPGKRKQAPWHRFAAVAAVLCLLLVSGIIFPRAVQMPSPASDLVIMPIEPFKEVAVLEVEDESIAVQDKPVTYEHPPVSDQPLITDQPDVTAEPESSEEVVLIEETELSEKLQTTDKPDQPGQDEIGIEQEPLEQPEQPIKPEAHDEPKDPKKPEQPEIAALEEGPDQPKTVDESVITEQPEVVEEKAVEAESDKEQKEPEQADDLAITTKPDLDKKPEKAPPEWPSSIPGGYQYKGMVDLKGKSEPLYMAAIYRNEDVDLLLVKSDPSEEELTVFVDRLSKKMQVLLIDDEGDLSTISPDLKTCSGLAWEKNGRNQALLVLFGTLEEEELLNILLKLE